MSNYGNNNQFNDPDLVFFEQEPEFVLTDWEGKQLRVAAYCRVSTDHENQSTSYELQTSYYKNYVGNHPNWTLVGIYADEGLSATSYTKRDDFKRMLKDCEKGKIDLIITKNVSRFSRNVVDCLGIARNLLAAKHPVGIYFQENNINTLTHDNELMLTMLSSLAQAESQAKRDSMLWSLAGRFGRGQFLTPTNNLLGYNTNEDKEMVVEEEGAKTVRAIYKAFLAGYPLTKIAYLLGYYQRPTAKGNRFWSPSSVRNILINEKYCGAATGRKTFTVDVFSHKKKKNKGQIRSVYKGNHHEPIVSKAEHLQALMLLKSRRTSHYYNTEYAIRVVREGLLMGFIPVNPSFGGYKANHYIGALEAADITMPPINAEVIEIKNATVARIQEFSHSMLANISISEKQLKFNTDCLKFFPDTAFVEILFHPAELIIAVRQTDIENKNAVLWGKNPIGAGHLCKNIYKFCGWQPKIRYKIMADCFNRNGENLIMFDLHGAEFIVKESAEKKSVDENGDSVSVWKDISTLLQPEKWQENFGRDIISHATTGRRWLALTLDDWKVNAPAEDVAGFDGFSPANTFADGQSIDDDGLLLAFGEFFTESSDIKLERGSDNEQGNIDSK